MRFKKGFTLRNIVGENVLVAEGTENINFDKLIVLNETAKFIWESLQDKEFTLYDTVGLILSEYDVEEEKAKSDIETLFEQLRGIGILED